MTKRLEMAIKEAIDCHSGQLDKTGKPAILHPLAVMLDCNKRADFFEDEMIVAVLHDVLEDTIDPSKQTAYLSWVARKFGDKIADALDAITRKEGERYNDYIGRVKKNDIATIVKVSDLIHNLFHRGEVKESLRKRYVEALCWLEYME